MPNGPEIRLAVKADTPLVQAVCNALSPSVRLETTINSGSNSPENFGRALGPKVILAISDGQAERNGSLRQKSDGEPRPALLVSYVYLERFLKRKFRYDYRDWVLDSGAFSAHNSGTEILLQSFIDKAKELIVSDPTLSEVFSLDVIGDWKASRKNCEEMWSQGISAIPTYHVGEPWEVLIGLSKDYPKIALGGAVGFRGKLKWAEQCFSRVWPKAIHGFGFGSEKAIMSLPFHSVDATNWEIGPCKYGAWKAYGGQTVSVRGSNQNLRVEVEWYLALEKRAQEKWKKEMAAVQAIHPSVRLALSCSGANNDARLSSAIGKEAPE